MPAGDFLCGQGETNPWTQSSRSGHRAKACPPRARSDSDRHSIQSVDRALVLLETIAEAGGEASLTDLANRTGLNISTCHHLLTTLIQRGFAAKMPGRRLYALGGRILYLGHACLQVDLPRRAQPYLETINQATGETVHLAALQGDSVVTLAVRETRHAVRADTGKVGRMEAPHATSVGKAIMAWLPEDEIHRILTGGMKRFTDKTITEFPALLESLRVVRRKRLRHRSRGISVRRHLCRCRNPRSGRHGDRRDQRIDADHTRKRGTRGPHPRRGQRRNTRLSAEFGEPTSQAGAA
jgi:DNA-binding IclR family transcriptional regulator